MNIPSTNLSLIPKAKSVPAEDLTGATILLYGERKIGKTSLLSHYPDTLFLMFEPGGSGLSLYQIAVTDWSHFMKVVDELLGATNFKHVVIDTSDIAYEMCTTYTCKKDGVSHPSEGNYGSVYANIDANFKKEVNRLLKSGRGVTFISHADDKEFESLTGKKYQKTIPSVSKRAYKFIVGLADIIAYYGYYGQERFLTIRGSDSLESGHRMSRNFWIEGGLEKSDELVAKRNKMIDEGASEAELDAIGQEISSLRVHSIPMGSDEAMAYTNFTRAFNNRQAEAFNLEGELTGIREKQTKPKFISKK